MRSFYQNFFLIVLSLLSFAPLSRAQLTVPQSSPKARIMQTIGLTEVTVEYSRPNVILDDEDRTGAIWGKLVPWETTPNQMTGKSYPWRAGANENTVIAFSSDVQIEGKDLPAGSYSFHVIPHEDGTATLIFNRDDHQWGSFNYDESQDALRVKVETKEGAQTNQLTYYFPEVSKESAVCELAWEQKRFPFTIGVNTHEVALEHMRQELGQSTGFVWQTLNTAANYCLDNEVELEQGLQWIDRGILYFGGNFTMLNTKARLLEKMGKAEDAETFRKKAVAMGTVRELYINGSTLVNAGETDKGLTILQKAYDKYHALGYNDPVDECLVNLGLASAYAAKKDRKMALKYGKAGIEKAPPNLKAVAEGFVAKLQEPDSSSGN
ncbi:DUF2911 domain-containing protein [Flavilitoribacter nigricans]|uniref:DUF2911 domain-containing protein n=1 Tax=Flavilitoribacter nigricans (strain ATCC 23147 / DSM 23189 / NBRC 102662 / NCIMB 1420 / SS-2) TaxID=1122177 RepID=A0A2D0MZ11_FLAN2|nr:DUF2911 domain-containing protein [Flavilitoribacter nigricans]PHN01358.1 hypothetical protein CRP01_37470 [Flavilitoribacter nigricans DSM 23189 = NBRC 102662]